MRTLFIVALLLPLSAFSAEVPLGGDRVGFQGAQPAVLVVQDDERLPADLSIGGVAISAITVHRQGLLAIEGGRFDVAAPVQLGDLAMASLIAPFWAPLSPTADCPVGPDEGDADGPPEDRVMRVDGESSVAIVWHDRPLAGCPAGGQRATFAVGMTWDADGVVHRVEFTYEALPGETLVVEPRAGFRLAPRDQEARVFELLPDGDAPLRGRAKRLADGSSDGDPGRWTIDLGANGEIVGELEPIQRGPDGEFDAPDGVRAADNCPWAFNPLQADLDNDLVGDACDDDDDDDEVDDPDDNCPLTYNLDQRDLDHDGRGDTCDGDRDGDGWNNIVDLCPDHHDPGNVDRDRDGMGDACDRDADGDDPWAVFFGRPDADRCPLLFDPWRIDSDGDGLGDACDLRPGVACARDCAHHADADGDGISHMNDRCPYVYDPDQRDTDADGLGDACDPDADGDGLSDWLAPGPMVPHAFGGHAP